MQLPHQPTIVKIPLKHIRPSRACARTLKVLLVLAQAACSKTSDAPPVARGLSLPDGHVASELVAALDTNVMKQMEQRTGTWQEADAASEWRAMANGGKVRVIDETMRVGETSTRRITHYYTDDGAVVAYYEFRIQIVTAGDRPPAKQFVLLKLEFQHDTISHSEKTVDGVAQPIQSFEVDNARKHSMVLFDAAKSAPATTPQKP